MFDITDKNSGVHAILPEVFDEKTMYSLIRCLTDENLDASNGSVILDFKNLTRIGAGGVAVISNSIELLRRSYVSVKCINADSNCKAFKQLRDFGFLLKYCDESLSPEISIWRMPLRIVHEENIYSYITTDLIPWIAAAFDVEEIQLSNVTAAFQEIFNNIIDHSTVDIGCACAQYDKPSGTIRVCISDFGIGIPKKVRGLIPKIKTDGAAIAKACEHGFTTQSTPRNRGAGLHVIIRSLVNANKGSVSIYSNCGVYLSKQVSTDSGESQIKTTVRTSRDFYPGTMFFVTLNARDFVPTDTQERFQW